MRFQYIIFFKQWRKGEQRIMDYEGVGVGGTVTEKGCMKQADDGGDILDLDYLSVSLSVMSYSL